MSGITLAGLALPRTPADSRRWGLVCLACASTVVAVLVGLRILRYPVMLDEATDQTDPSGGSYASFIWEEGLRPGTLAGVLLCCIPPLVLLVQALRVGSTARERRLIAVRVCGASQRQLRALGTLEGAIAGACGGLVGIAGYLLLAWVTPSIPLVHLRIVPHADRLDLLVAPAAVLAVAALAGISATLGTREVVVAPQRVNLRAPRPLPRSRQHVSLLLAALWLGNLTVVALSDYPVLSVYVLMVLSVVLSFAAGPYLVLAAARRLDRSRDPMRQLAAARLRAEPRTPGRVAAVVMVCGAAFYLGSLFLVAAPWLDTFDRSFFVAGALLALGGAVVALGVSVLSLLVAAAEQILDARRATAVLTAFGVSTSDLRRALRRQLTVPAGLAAVVGAVLAAAIAALEAPAASLLYAVVGVPLATVPALFSAWLASAFLGPQVADATSAENLRTA